MSKLRATASFVAIPDDSTSNSFVSGISSSPESRSLRRTLPWLDGDIDVDAGLSPARDGTFGATSNSPELPDSPRATLVPVGRGTSASLSLSPRSTQKVSFSPPELQRSGRAMESSTVAAQREFVARANEMFASVQAEAQQLVATLEEFHEDKTPTKGPKDQSTMRKALRRKLAVLDELVGQADRGHRKPSCLKPFQHRQREQMASSIDAFERRLAHNEAAKSRVFQPEEALLLQLRKALAIEDKRLPTWDQF